MTENYSVLMSVYYKEKAEYLRESMQSMFDQTIPTDDFVLVCDGPLNDDLNTVIADMQKKYGDVLNVVRLEKNEGLGNALNYGMKFCKNNLVARMDSDDISRPERVEKQLAVFSQNSGIAICGGIVEEFRETPNMVETRRVMPETQAEITFYAKKRNPFNHPCVMCKKSDVIAAGGYKDFYLLEDYYLWIRMLLMDCQGYNLQQPLLWMRTGSDLYKRRGGWKYAKSQARLFGYMKARGFIGDGDYMVASTLRGIIALMPNRVRIFLYKNILRKLRN